MEKFSIEHEPDRILHVRLFDHLTSDEAFDLISAVEQVLDASAPGVLLLVERLRPTWMPVDGQISAGQMMRHHNLARVAICGPSISGGAASQFMGKISRKGMHVCLTVAEAREFLLAPDAEAPDVSMNLGDL